MKKISLEETDTLQTLHSLQTLPKEKLHECIENTSNNLGLTMGEYKNYAENRLSIEEDKYEEQIKEAEEKDYEASFPSS